MLDQSSLGMYGSCIEKLSFTEDGSNNLKGSDGQQPKFDYGGKIGCPNSSKFYIRADRSTHPGVITIRNEVAYIVGVGKV